MDLSLPVAGAIGVMVLLAIAAWFLSAKTWRWHTVTLVALNFIVGLGCVILAMMTLKAEKLWGEVVRDYETKIGQVQKENAALVSGEEKDGKLQPGITQLTKLIHEATSQRGRAWFRGKAAAAANGGLSIAFDTEPGQIAPKTVVQVFDETVRKDGGEYVGEFIVTAQAGKSVDMTPAVPVNSREVNKVRKADKVSMYEVIPRDDHDALAQLTKEQRDDLLGNLSEEVRKEYESDTQSVEAMDSVPADRVEVLLRFKKEFTTAKPLSAATEGELKIAEGQTAWMLKAKHGTVPGADELVAQGVAEPVADTKPRYVRRLRDYSVLLADLRRQKLQTNSAATETAREAQRLKESQAFVTQAITQEDALRTALRDDISHFKAESTAVAAYLAKLGQQQSELLTKLRSVFSENINMANEIVQWNWRAVDESNRRRAPPDASASADR